MQGEALANFKKDLENLKHEQERHRIRERQIDTEPNKTIERKSRVTVENA